MIKDLDIELHEKEDGKAEQMNFGGDDLVDRGADMTMDLLKKDVVVVMKRARLRSIGGFLMYRNKSEIEGAGGHGEILEKAREIRTRMINKIILSVLMPEGSWFSYEDLFEGGGREAFTIIRGCLECIGTGLEGAE